jgi:hypothetical protein
MRPASKRHIFTIIVMLLVLMPMAASCHSSIPEPEIPKAAIIDQLYDFQANEAFTDTATSMLDDYGLQVDNIRGEQVTLNLYGNLPTQGYKVIIFRAHSGLLQLTEDETGPTYLFTGEPYTITKNVWEQLEDSISPGRVTSESSPVFAISPEFVERDMKSDFGNTVIIMMGCATTYKSDMAEAFIDKGASAYIGWSASVTLGHVDEATTVLLNNLFVKKLSLQDAVTATMSEVGFDPEYKAHLQYYPAVAGKKSLSELIEAS